MDVAKRRLEITQFVWILRVKIDTESLRHLVAILRVIYVDDLHIRWAILHLSTVGKQQPVDRWVGSTTLQEEWHPERPFPEIRNDKTDTGKPCATHSKFQVRREIAP